MAPFSRGADPHDEALALIPWVVNGTAGAEHIAALQAHLAQCAACRGEYQTQVQLHGVLQEEGSVVFTAESLQKLQGRIDAPAREPATESGLAAAAATAAVEAGAAPGAMAAAPAGAIQATLAARAGSPRTVRWLAAAVIVQAVGLGFSAWLLHAQPRLPEASYATLTTPPTDYSGGSRVRAVFAPAVTLEELQRLLHAAGAHIVDGPTDAGVYTLGFAPGETATAAQVAAHLALLRAHAGVLLAEPLDDPGAS